MSTRLRARAYGGQNQRAVKLLPITFFGSIAYKMSLLSSLAESFPAGEEGRFPLMSASYAFFITEER
jgi:hypothetical protein